MLAEFSKGDLVWFDPGIGYVLPGEVGEFHSQAQVRHNGREAQYNLCINQETPAPSALAEYHKISQPTLQFSYSLLQL